MRILFISSGNNRDFAISPFIQRQANSIEALGHKVDFFVVNGRGVLGYLKNIQKLKRHIETKKYDIIHAHYTYNGFLSILATRRIPIIVSYMGSDTLGSVNSKGRLKPLSYINILVSIIIQPFISAIIVKSHNLEKYIFCKKKLNLIPNGVDIISFSCRDKQDARRFLNLDLKSKTVLFLGDKANDRKNYILLKKSAMHFNDKISIITPYPAAVQNVNSYYNAADVLVLTSYSEGSPNVVKEAMASGCPVVSTDVGDVKWLFGEEPGHFICEFTSKDVARKIMFALDYSEKEGKTKGQKRILELELDAESVAKKIILLYKKNLKHSI